MYSLLQELSRRDGLSIALSGRNEDELYPLLKYLSANVAKPRYAPLLLPVCDMVTGKINWIILICLEGFCFFFAINAPPPSLLSPLSLSSLLLDIYGGVLSTSKGVQALFRVLKVKIDREVQFQKRAFELLGTLDTILTAAMATERHKAIASDVMRTPLCAVEQKLNPPLS